MGEAFVASLLSMTASSEGRQGRQRDLGVGRNTAMSSPETPVCPLDPVVLLDAAAPGLARHPSILFITAFYYPCVYVYGRII